MMALQIYYCICSSGSIDPRRSWNKKIKQQVLKGNSNEALLTYKKMLEHGYHGDNYTFPVILKAATNLLSSSSACMLHAQSIKTGFWLHEFVQTSLLNLYSSLGLVDEACKVFNQMVYKDLISWNSMLNAYASSGLMDNAANLFDKMLIKDTISFNIMISGYASTKNVESARAIFDKIRMTGGDTISWNSMILAYTKIGEMNKAVELFDEMPLRNIVSWNTMLCGYLQSGCYSDVIELFDEMMGNDLEIQPNRVTLTTVLSTCAHMGALELGVEIHLLSMNIGLTLDPHVMASLIDMYAKCGSIERALELFYKFNSKDAYCWNVMVSGLALHGNGRAALSLFQHMINSRVIPDEVTFVGVLSACSHAGLVEEGWWLFENMESKYGVSPKPEHYGCMVDLLGRAGSLESALKLIETMPVEPGPSVWGALLSACVTRQSFKIGEIVAKHLISRVERLSDGEYVMLANLYALCGRWDESNRWRAMMDEVGISKTAGCSMVEVNGKIYTFLAGDVELS